MNRLNTNTTTFSRVKKITERSIDIPVSYTHLAEKDSTDLMMTVTVIVSLIFSIALFMMLPYFLSRFLKQIISSETVILVAEGIVKLVIFTGSVSYTHL